MVTDIKYSITRAFSLIELMVVIAIIGILAAVAVPYYQGYIIRSKLSAGLAILESLKEQATEYYSINSIFPTLANLNKINTDFATDAVSWGNVGPNGWTGGDNTLPFVEIQYNVDVIPDQTAPRLAFLGTLNNAGTVTWTCYTYFVSNVDSSINEKFLPSGCSVHQ